MKRYIVILGMIALTSCTQATEKAATVVSDVNAGLSDPDVQRGFQMACWSLTAADAAFKVFYATRPDADAGIVADEAKAISGAQAICAAPPTDLKSATAAILASYRAVTAKVPG